MKVSQSNYLKNQKPLVDDLVNLLLNSFEYASVLATDAQGKKLIVDFSGSSVADGTLTERGYVARVFNGLGYSEYSFNELYKDRVPHIADNIIKTAKDDLSKLKKGGININHYPLIDDKPLEESFFGDVEIDPDKLTTAEKLDKMNKMLEKAKTYSDLLIDFKVVYEDLHISKYFRSKNRKLTQSYVFSTANSLALAGKDDVVKYEYDGVSGQKGSETLDELNGMLKNIVNNAVELLTSERVTPGTYDVICDPKVSGLIAHEAFGHGVEMDMFVKNRAKGAEFIGEYVASEKTMMQDGAKSAKNVASYLFDDEGTLGTDTHVIESGILKSGISDLLSAMKLNAVPTGNGRRESFERKAYARMTNTFFAPGNDQLNDMIASIKNGYLLESYNSGMEDPKNWGIQCMITKGREIKDGKLTGKIIAPVLMTGYVPDVLKSISMVSGDDLYLSGSGHCGKGYKEWAKTSIGGTYIKLRGRLG